ncbi:hypothetical protein SISSUDRAFT_1067368 [Sistotremastrum suecicum HHB10207 ss-3]|uniref:FIST domain-containing protein n=1 Tax=Sistotremastrum suecicum HHB10207 ss-3 TaxID=1314776 RepID=A0A165X703_9AGAM|nr:hypothetical protein SISSUDRAFT_1067368 [Sistotremastrum suecicum HHB10207 ss-3]
MQRALTLISKSPEKLARHLTQSLAQHRNDTLLFTISSNVEAPQLGPLVSALTALSDRYIGCLSAPLSFSSNEAICSMAFFDRQKSITWRSDASAPPPAQVGRWHKSSPASQSVPHSLDANQDWERLWSSSGPSSSPLPSLPESLIGTNDVSSLIYLNDGPNESLSRALQTSFPASHQMALHASSTPFLTGRPYTLFQDRSRIFSQGAVGIALGNLASPQGRTSHFEGFQPIGTPNTVTRQVSWFYSDGNLIHTLGGANPTRILMKWLEDTHKPATLTKDVNIYLAILSSSANEPIQRLYGITSGDPGRGSIALDAQVGHLTGRRVQFYHRPNDLKVVPFSSSPTPSSVIFVPASGDGAHIEVSAAKLASEEVSCLENVCLSVSENGFSLQSPTSGDATSPWHSRIPGTLTRWQWP